MLPARNPFRICVTASCIEKRNLDETNFLELDDNAEILQGFGKPSAETLLYLTIYRFVPKVRAILHSHSVWCTILANHLYKQGTIEMEGYEVLKGLSGGETHDHREKIPIVENSQDSVALSHVVENVLRDNDNIHGIYLRRHGLYAWDDSVAEARRHIEIFEFLFGMLGRSLNAGSHRSGHSKQR